MHCFCVCKSRPDCLQSLSAIFKLEDRVWSAETHVDLVQKGGSLPRVFGLECAANPDTKIQIGHPPPEPGSALATCQPDGLQARRGERGGRRRRRARRIRARRIIRIRGRKQNMVSGGNRWEMGGAPCETIYPSFLTDGLQRRTRLRQRPACSAALLRRKGRRW